jgi:hypothetical protein
MNKDDPIDHLSVSEAEREIVQEKDKALARSDQPSVSSDGDQRAVEMGDSIQGEVMASICPKDMKHCLDDCCRGSGICGATGRELLEWCAVCSQPYDDFIDCDCGDAWDDYDGEGDETDATE